MDDPTRPEAVEDTRLSYAVGASPSQASDRGLDALVRAIEMLTEGIHELKCRIGNSAQDVISEAAMRVGNLLLYPQSQRVVVAGEDVALAAGEFKLLHRLVADSPGVVTSEDLLAAYSGHVNDEYGGNLRVYIRRLRVKLNGTRMIWSGRILNVRSIGYRIVGP